MTFESSIAGDGTAGEHAMENPAISGQGPAHDWTFLSNHATVLLCIAKEPGIRVRDVAERVGITVRAVLRILDDLESAGYLSRAREGRRNRYQIHAGLPFRHPVAAHREVSAFLDLILSRGADAECGPEVA